MTIHIEFEAPDRVIIRASGVLRRDELDARKRELFAHMQVHGRCHVLMLLDKDFANLQAFAKWDDIEEDAYIQQHVIRLAMVGDLRWRDSALLFFLSGLVPFQMEYFKAGQEEFARAWLLD
jgi:hypothetical protein